MDDFFEAYFGESNGAEFSDVKPDLAPKEKLDIKDSFKIFKVVKVSKDGQKENC